MKDFSNQSLPFVFPSPVGKLPKIQLFLLWEEGCSNFFCIESSINNPTVLHVETDIEFFFAL